MKIYKEKYQVFKNGVIKDLITHKILPQYTSNYGYRTVFLKFQGNTTSYYVHEIVAECYIPKPELNPELYTIVVHLDKNKLNNESSNLAWQTEEVQIPNVPKITNTPSISQTESKTYTANLDPDFKPLNENEEYKNIYEGLYRIYKDGKVYSNKDNVFVTQTLSKASNSFNVKIYNPIKDKYDTVYVHRLMADAFMENPHNSKFLRHKDGNNQNNNLDNLEWLIPSKTSLKQYKATEKRQKKREAKRLKQIKPKETIIPPIQPEPIISEIQLTKEEIQAVTKPQQSLYKDIKEAAKSQSQSMENKETKYRFLNKEYNAEELIEVLIYFGKLQDVEKI